MSKTYFLPLKLPTHTHTVISPKQIQEKTNPSTRKSRKQTDEWVIEEGGSREIAKGYLDGDGEVVGVITGDNDVVGQNDDVVLDFIGDALSASGG